MFAAGGSVISEEWLHRVSTLIRDRLDRRLALAAAIAVVAAMLTVASVAQAATWSSAITVPDSAAASGAVVARDGAGADTVAWLQSGASEGVGVSTRALGGPLATSILTAEGAVPVDPPAVTVDPRGSGDDRLDRAGLSARRAVADNYVAGMSGALGERQTLPAARTGDDPGSVDATVTPSGETIFVWTQAVDDVDRVRTLVRSADGGLSDAFTLSDGDAAASAPQVATAAGGAVVTWLQTSTTSQTNGDRDIDRTVTRPGGAANQVRLRPRGHLERGDGDDGHDGQGRG